MARVVQAGGNRESYWRLLISRWKRSGLSVRAFCRAEGVNEPKFYWWRRELLRRDQPQPASKPAFLAVRVVDDKPEPPALGVEVVLANGRSVRVTAGFDPQTLLRVVELLEGGGQSC